MAKHKRKRIKNEPRTQKENPARSAQVYYLNRKHAGIRVTEENALTYSAVWSAVRIISETIAGLGWHLLQRAGQAKERIYEHPVARILQQPNPEMRSFTTREVMQAWALTWGNGYAEIERDLMGRPVRIWPIPPDRVSAKRDEGNNLIYIVMNADGTGVEIPSRDMFHLKGLGWDGLTGYSVIAFAARSLGLGIAAEEFGAGFFGNGASLGGVLEHPGTLDEDGRKNLRESWQNMYSGPYSAGKTALLEEGMSYKSIGIPPDDAQFLETRKFQITDVARWFRVPPHKLADLERATFSNIEEQNIDFVQDTVVPWALRWEEEADAKLIGAQSRNRLFTKFNINSLLRGSIEKRFNAYAIGRQWGWLSANDVRTLEDMNPLPNDEGNVYLSPSNMIPTDKLGEMEPPSLSGGAITEIVPNDDDGANSQPNNRAYNRLFADAAGRCLGREVNRLARIPEKLKTEADFAAWMLQFYNKHRGFVVDAFRPCAYTMAENALGNIPAGIDTALDLFAGAYINDSYNEVVSAWVEGDINSFSERATGSWPQEIAAQLLDDLAKVITIEAIKGKKGGENA